MNSVIKRMSPVRSQHHMTVAVAVADVVGEAALDERGSLEGLRARLEKLTEIVGELVERSDDPLAILNTVSHGWEEYS